MRTLQLFLLSVLPFNDAFAQLDSTKIFEESKGSWTVPVQHFSQIEKFDSTRIYECRPRITTAFIASEDNVVRAVFDGKVSGVHYVDDLYVLITTFGDYCITYFGLTLPLVKKNDFIKQGTILSRMQKNIDGEFRVEVYLSKKEVTVDPFKWFNFTFNR